ncbi:MAG TPA: pseudouridine synthase [Candidatus Saccharimonadales bacterium]|nr:pseudouridine synthase [Candidatus Saccharimonadales bacterium]
MRINLYIAKSSQLSRRSADQAIASSRVRINGIIAKIGDSVDSKDLVTLDNQSIKLPNTNTTIILNKPVGYVCSRSGQGNHTVFELLPKDLQKLQTVGRLDKNSSGLIILSDDGDLAHRLTHPRFAKQKIYEVRLDRTLSVKHQADIDGPGVKLEDGPSRFGLTRLGKDRINWRITMHEGRNRQIRRTFAEQGYQVKALHRTQFDEYSLGKLKTGKFIIADI